MTYLAFWMAQIRVLWLRNPPMLPWARQDQLLRHALITSVSENITPYIAAAPTAQHAWETLANLYANRSRARVITLKERLQNMRRDGRSISEYLRTLKAVQNFERLQHLFERETPLYLLMISMIGWWLMKTVSDGKILNWKPLLSLPTLLEQPQHPLPPS
ncbi:hypothetical protein SLEP1_g2846 [Rubroshorea leprosula]|uniref:Retrotransposon gag domain-containing protein n=1 Tax=Rubroshorea leprosula TaxID=152421 RepID=A0AAV5HQ00_9ROSI|nr:hypothetical protein SLEP1_g2846 [Rubroshorea leprosula]